MVITTNYMASLSAPILPVGIRFRMYIQVATAGAMVTCTSRTPTGSGGLPQPAVIVTRTSCTWIVTLSSPSIMLIKPSGLLSTVSPAPYYARRYPLSYVFSGYYYWGNGSLFYQGSYGGWWPTTASSDSNAYYLRMGSSGLDPQNNTIKAYGFALRCVSYSTSARRYPLSYVYSGLYRWDFGNLDGQDSGGYWRSTAANGNSGAYYLVMYSSGLNPQDNNYGRAFGFPLRCASGE